MTKARLEAFSDGVIAIIITIMVLEMRPPAQADLVGLGTVGSHVAAYVLSFVFIGIYWVNHHHLLQAAECVNGRILWANLHLLFWLSLIPFATAWMGADGWAGLAPVPVALYGAVLLFAGMAYFLLSQALIQQHGRGSTLAKAIGKDVKGRLSIAAYTLAIAAAFFRPWIAVSFYVLVALVWLIPDKRIERELGVEDCDPT